MCAKVEQPFASSVGGTVGDTREVLDRQRETLGVVWMAGEQWEDDTSFPAAGRIQLSSPPFAGPVTPL